MPSAPPPTAARARGHRRPPAEPGAARRLVAGIAARRAAIARADQAPRPDAAGADDLGPRQPRHCGRGDPRGRGRFHREAVQGRQIAPPRRAGDRDRPAAPRECHAPPADRQRRCPVGQFGRDQHRARDDQARRADRKPGDDHRPGRGRQGNRRADDPQLEPARQRAVHRRLGGNDEPRAGRGRIVRHRGRRRAAPGPARAGAWRDLVPRRDRRHAADDPGENPARPDRPEPHQGRGAAPGQGRRSRPVGDFAHPCPTKSPRGASAKIFIIASTSSR